MFGAVLPLIPWFLGSGDAATWTSIIVGVLAAAVVGALVGKFAERPLWLTMLRQVAIVLAACAITYAIGELVGVNVSG
jgi:VIT1/CCC1 family predicted Fe2+/Mn2+ transporter